jgi:hypothetical protein
MRNYLSSCLSLFILLFVMSGCGGGGVNPVLPGVGNDQSTDQTAVADGHAPVLVPERTISQKELFNHMVLGVYDVFIDPQNDVVEFTPARDLGAIGDAYDLEIIPYLVKGQCTQPGGCAKVVSKGIGPDGNYHINVKIRHPFPESSMQSRLDLHVFDVRIITIYSGETEFQNIKIYDCDQQEVNAITNTEFLLNADGYTTHFDDLGVMTPGNLNPYKMAFNKPSNGPFDANNPTGHNVMNMGCDWGDEIEFIFLGSMEPVISRWVVDAAYGQSSTFGTRLNPQYYLPWFHRKEPWKVEIVETSNHLKSGVNILDCSTAKIDVRVWDWQDQYAVDVNYPNPNNLTGIKEESKIKIVEVSVPGLNCYVPNDTAFSSPNNTQAGDCQPFVYKFSINNFEAAPTGEYVGLVAARDTIHGTRGPETYKENHFGMCEVFDYSTYQIFTIDVKANQVPVIDNATSVPPSGTIDEGTRVELDGCDASDPDGEIITYEWSQIPPNPVGVFGNKNACSTYWIAPDVEHNTIFHLRLKVMDCAGADDILEDIASFTVKDIINKSIEIVEPNGGEQWTIGETHNITWTSTGLDGTRVKIEYSINGGGNWLPINLDTENDNTYSWQIPGPITSAALVKITSLSSPSVSDTSNNFSIIEIKSLELQLPSGGEYWTKGNEYSIMWTWVGSIEFVKIEYSLNGTTNWQSITEQTPNDGCEPWVIPDEISATAKVKISEYNNPVVYDVSNSAFTIRNIRVTSPNGGEEWTVGEDHSITWTSTTVGDMESNVMIYVSRDGGSWAAITPPSGAQNTGNYQWQVTDPPSDSTFIQICSKGEPIVCDTSNASFKILANTQCNPDNNPPDTCIDSGCNSYPADTPSVTLYVSGSDPNNCTPSESLQFSWRKRLNSGSWGSWSSYTTGSSVTVTGLSAGYWDVEVRARDLALNVDPEPATCSFTIADLSQTITVTSPNGGEKWTKGNQYTITWSSSGNIEFVKIEYSLDGATNWQLINEGSPDDGNHYWIIPDELSTTAKVKVSVSGTPAVYDVSNAPFTIRNFRVTSPNGGEDWPIGEDHNITWSSTGITGNVIIYGQRNGGLWWEITHTPNDYYSYTWQITGPASEQTLVAICSIETPVVSDTSDASFRIIATCTPDNDPPNTCIDSGCNDYPAGTPAVILYVSGSDPNDCTPSSSLQFSWRNRHNSGSWSNWSNYSSDDSITFPVSAGDWDVEVRARDLALNVDPTPYPCNFNIADLLQTITVTSPNGGETWYVDEVRSITWTSIGITGDISIEVSRNGGSSWESIISGEENDGVFYWQVTGPATPSAKIKITSNVYPTVYDRSNSNFNIAGLTQSITLISPNGGEQWVAGDVHDIIWTSENITGDLILELSLGSGWNFLGVVPNTGILSWPVSNYPTVQAKIRITWQEDYDIRDESDGFFTILEPGFYKTWGGYNVDNSWGGVIDGNSNVYRAGFTSSYGVGEI